MIRIMMIILLVIANFCLVKSQTLEEVSSKLLGKPRLKSENSMLSTNFGMLVFKSVEKKGYTIKVVVKLTNGQYNYNSIINSEKNATIKVGTIWTDVIFVYEPILTRHFNNLNDAMTYFESIDKSGCEVYSDTHIYKHENKEKYIVGIFNIYRPADDETGEFDYTGKMLGKNYILLK